MFSFEKRDLGSRSLCVVKGIETGFASEALVRSPMRFIHTFNKLEKIILSSKLPLTPSTF